MAREDDARALADALVGLAERSGLRVAALLTQMDVPLGRTIGNALRCASASTCFGEAGQRIPWSCRSNSRRSWCGSGRGGPSSEAARYAVRTSLSDGTGLAMFRAIVERQGGDAGMIDYSLTLPQAPVREMFVAPRGGYVARYDAGVLVARPCNSGPGEK